MSFTKWIKDNKALTATGLVLLGGGITAAIVLPQVFSSEVSVEDSITESKIKEINDKYSSLAAKGVLDMNDSKQIKELKDFDELLKKKPKLAGRLNKDVVKKAKAKVQLIQKIEKETQDLHFLMNTASGEAPRTEDGKASLTEEDRKKKIIDIQASLGALRAKNVKLSESVDKYISKVPKPNDDNASKSDNDNEPKPDNTTFSTSAKFIGPISRFSTSKKFIGPKYYHNHTLTLSEQKIRDARQKKNKDEKSDVIFDVFASESSESSDQEIAFNLFDADFDASKIDTLEESIDLDFLKNDFVAKDMTPDEKAKYDATLKKEQLKTKKKNAQKKLKENQLWQKGIDKKAADDAAAKKAADDASAKKAADDTEAATKAAQSKGLIATMTSWLGY